MLFFLVEGLRENAFLVVNFLRVVFRAFAMMLMPLFPPVWYCTFLLILAIIDLNTLSIAMEVLKEV